MGILSRHVSTWRLFSCAYVYVYMRAFVTDYPIICHALPSMYLPLIWR